MKTDNARFEVWIRGHGEVKITLKPGQTLHWSRSWPTDEGYSFLSYRWSLDDGIVYETCRDGGCDCDGPIEYYSERWQTVKELSQDDETEVVWNEGRRRTYDQFAERAGY